MIRLLCMYVARAYGNIAGRDTSFKNLTFAETSDEALKSSSYTLKIERTQLQYETINSVCDLTEQYCDQEGTFSLSVESQCLNLFDSFLACRLLGGPVILYSTIRNKSNSTGYKSFG